MSVPFAVLTVILVWSTTSLAVKWSVDQISFLTAASLRMMLASILCALLMVVMRWSFPLTRNALRVYVAVGIGLFCGLGGTYWAAQTLSSGLLAMSWGLAPLFTGLIASAVLKERFGWGEFLGVIVALLGLWFVFSTGHSMKVNAVGTLLILLVAILVQSIGLVALKQWGRDTPAFATTSGGIGVATLLFCTSWLLFDRQIPSVIHEKSLGAILYLAVIGNLLGLGAYNYLAKKVPAGKASLILLLTPVLALGLGHWLNAEPVSMQMLLGVALVFGGLITYQKPWKWLS